MRRVLTDTCKFVVASALASLVVVAFADVISTGVGMVKGRAVTSREVQIQNLLNAALYDKEPEKRLKKLNLDSRAFGRAVQETLLETVISLEAQNFNVIQISEEERKNAVARAQKVLKNSKVWKDLQVSPSELDVAVGKKIQAKRFVQFRAQSSVLPITDSEAQKYYNENRLKFGDLPFENFKENIKSYLSRTQVERRLKDWYDVLLNKYQVKNLVAEM